MLLFPDPLLPATFLRRENRFRAAALLDSRTIAVHVPNSGRLGELLTPGAACYVTPNPSPGRTSHTLRIVLYRGQLVSTDARLPAALFADAWLRGALAPDFDGYTQIAQEVQRGASRLDLLLTGPKRPRLWVETKSVTLVGDERTGLPEGIAFFPDAPTARGRKHLGELATAVSEGEEAAVVFVIQRGDARAFAPHPTADPAFAAALREAQRGGVMVFAYTCDVTLAGIEIASIPVSLIPDAPVGSTAPPAPPAAMRAEWRARRSGRGCDRARPRAGPAGPPPVRTTAAAGPRGSGCRR